MDKPVNILREEIFIKLIQYHARKSRDKKDKSTQIKNNTLLNVK